MFQIVLFEFMFIHICLAYICPYVTSAEQNASLSSPHETVPAQSSCLTKPILVQSIHWQIIPFCQIKIKQYKQTAVDQQHVPTMNEPSIGHMAISDHLYINHCRGNRLLIQKPIWGL